MNTLTDQQIFDRVAKHLLIQKMKSHATHGFSSCAYLNDSGLRCAIGCLFKRDGESNDIASELDGGLGNYLVRDEIVKLLDFEATPEQLDTMYSYVTNQPGILAALQALHDSYDADEWEEQLWLLAKARRLSDAVVWSTKCV